MTYYSSPTSLSNPTLQTEQGEGIVCRQGIPEPATEVRGTADEVWRPPGAVAASA